MKLSQHLKNYYHVNEKEQRKNFVVMPERFVYKKTTRHLETLVTEVTSWMLNMYRSRYVLMHFIFMVSAYNKYA